MSKEKQIINETLEKKYEYGFTTDIEQETIDPGLDENVIKIISKKKNEPKWLLDWRLEAFDQFKKMSEPDWSNLNIPKINFREVVVAPPGAMTMPGSPNMIIGDIVCPMFFS